MYFFQGSDQITEMAKENGTILSGFCFRTPWKFFSVVISVLSPVQQLSSLCVCVPAWNCISSTLWQGKGYKSHHKVLTCRVASFYITFLIRETCI